MPTQGGTAGTPAPGGTAGSEAVGGAPGEPGTPAAPATAAETPASAGTPVPPGAVAIAGQGQPVSNKAIELRVTSHRTAPEIEGRAAPQGREFVIVDSAWKNLIPPQKVNRKKATDRTAGMGGLGFGGGATAADRAADEANTTLEPVPFEIGPMTSHVWLIADGRDVSGIDEDATNAIDGHLPVSSLKIPAQNAVRSGPLVFQAPANAKALSLLMLDSANGHLLVPITGAAPTLVSSLGGASRSNAYVDLALAGASWSESATPRSKTLVATLRGISRQEALVDIPFGEFSYLQTGQGCIVEPDTASASPAVVQPLSPMGRFVPFVPREGQLAFTVPDDTQSATLLLRLRGQAPIDLPVVGDGSLRMPPVRATHVDGKVLRVHVVGAGAPPAGLPPPGDGLEHLVVDYVVENLTTGTGAELQPEPQFALADDQGTQYPPAAESRQLPCRLTGANVVPAGSWRRFSLLYTVPSGQPLTLKYRGLESEGPLKVR
jgi:hypothetical protein